MNSTKFLLLLFVTVIANTALAAVSDRTAQPNALAPTTLSEEQEDFIREKTRLDRHLNETRSRLSNECYNTISRPALQIDCYNLLEKLNNLAYELSKTTQLDEVERVNREYRDIATELDKIESDIN